MRFNDKNYKNIDILLNDKPQDLLIPSYIFQNRNYTILESLIVYLRERKLLSYQKISTLIKRHVRDVYAAYQNAKKKELRTRYKISGAFVWIPISVFSDRKVSALEALVVHLKDVQNFSYHEIAVLLNRNDRTIWTVYHRANIKRKK